VEKRRDLKLPVLSAQQQSDGGFFLVIGQFAKNNKLLTFFWT
jgi:hypothetical protein